MSYEDYLELVKEHAGYQSKSCLKQKDIKSGTPVVVVGTAKPELNGTIAGINKKCANDERVIITIRENTPAATKMKAKAKNLVLLSSVLRRIRHAG